MNVTIQAAIISAIVAFFAALLTALVSYFRERSEREKWKRTLELEERRIKNEEYRRTLELNNLREIELHKVRLRTYPEVFSALTKLSEAWT
jgi:predicted component of type VI protein secretion system